MLAVRVLWLVLGVFWLIAEIRLALVSQVVDSEIASAENRSQRRLWLSILSGLGLALIFKYQRWLPIPINYLPRQLFAILIFIAGLVLRYVAVMRLGKFFTTHVTIQYQHQLITDGPYRWLRHPAYTGLLIALAGAGLAMGDVIAWLLLTVPSFLAFKSRIEIEEKMLNNEFGMLYQIYCQSSWKLLPGIY